MRACIRRGAAEVGGSCVELESGGRRLVLDVGLPLEMAGVAMRDLLPDVPGLWAPGDGSLEAVVLSHGHADHVGLADLVAPGVRVLAGEATARIAREAAFFTPAARELAIDGELRDGRPLQLGPFAVTPLLVDHSAFDAYALLVEAEGRRLLYTGDVRAHGRKGRLFDELGRRAHDVDVMLLEGTHVRRDEGRAGDSPTESDVEARCAETFRATAGMALVTYSAQNVDRLVTLYRAALRADRDFVMDLYTAAVAAATGRDTIPQAGWERVRVFLPRAQRARVIREEAFEKVDAVRPDRVYPEELAERAGELVMTFRMSMAPELERANCLAGASEVWSLWAGYLKGAGGERLREFLDRHRIPLVVHHASGHASVAELQRLAGAVGAARTIPVHTEAPGRFTELFDGVELRADGEWWDV